MANPKLRSILKLAVTILVSIAFIFAILFIGLIISQFLQSNEFSFQSIAIVVIFIGVSALIAGQTHRLGHFLAGTLLHYQLISYKLQDISMIPLQKEKDKINQIWYYAAGILCNLVLGLTTLLVILLAPLGLPTLLWLFLFTLSITWLATGTLQTVSYFNEGTPTDGKVLWGLLFRTDFSHYYVSTINLLTALKAGYRPSQIPMHSYNEDKELQSSDAIFLLYLYYKALELQKASVMLKYSKMLENNFAMIPQHLQPTVICELCYASTLKGQTHLAKSYFSLMRDFPAENRNLSYYRACAYYFFYGKGNIKQALSAISYALETYSTCEFEGIAAMEQALLQTLMQDITDNLE